MPAYEVLNDSNEVVNIINANKEFMADNYSNYRLRPDPDKADREAYVWRNAELVNTDIIAQTPDWPNRDDWLTYRQKLRDWPSTSDFPDTRPEFQSS